MQTTDILAENPADEPLTLDDLATAVDRRAETYALLARLYRAEADPGFLARLQATRFPVQTGNDELDRGYYLLARAASNVWENSVEELAVDYARAFIGNATDGYGAAYPIESVYTGEKRLTMQASRDEVLAIYLSEGLEKAPAWRDSEDHIAVELEFMQGLCLRASRALRAGDGAEAARLLTVQRSFFEDHLEPWVPEMTRALRAFAQSDLYRALAHLTDGFLQVEKAFFDDALEG